MLTFKNDFRGFVSCNRDKLEALFKNEDKTIEFISCDNPDRCLVRCLDTPLASNPHVCAWGAYQIAYDEDLIKSLELNELEVWAIILHEIGHIIRHDPYDNYTSLIENQCDDYSTLFGLQFYLASALCKMSASFNVIDLEQRLKHLSKSIVLYRPEWTCGRYVAEKQAALYYNLIEGMSYCFEGVSASVVGYLFDRKRGTGCPFSELLDILGLDVQSLISFIEQLISIGLIIPKEITANDIKEYREKVSSERKSHSQLPMTIKERIPVEHSSAENDFSDMVGGISSAMFELTYNCSEKCVHCYNIGATRNDNEVSHRGDLKEIHLNDYKRIIDELYDQGLFKVCLSGGDPFSKHEVWDIMKYLYSKDIAFDIYTNGQLLLGREKDLADLYPRTVAISIYSADASIHDRITRTNNSLERSLSVMRCLGQLAVPMNLKCCIMRPNKDSYRTVVSVANEVGAVPQFEISITDSVDGDKCASLYLRLKKNELENVLQDDIIPMQVGPGVPNYGRMDRSLEENACGAGYSSLCVTPDGKMIPCCAFHLELGDLTKESVIHILENSNTLRRWRSSRLSQYYECLKQEYCSYCALCPGLNYSENGDYRIPSENNCFVAKVRCGLANKMMEKRDFYHSGNKDDASEFSFGDLRRMIGG